MQKKDIEKKVVELMKLPQYKPLHEEEILKELAFDTKTLKIFWAAMKHLEEEGAIVRTRYDTYGLTEKMNLVAGTLSMTSKGYGFLLPKNKDEKDIFLPPNAILDAIDGDFVLVRINHRPKNKQAEGEIIRVLKRGKKRFIGDFIVGKDYAFVIPDDRKLGRDIFVAKRNFAGAKNKQKVVVEMISWPKNTKNAEGRIVEILGSKGDVGLEILAIIKNNEIETEFKKETMDEALNIAQEVSSADIDSSRRDLRSFNIITIDSDDAKDLDDAVYVKKINDFEWLLGVYIADVSHYVKENTPLDKEARERATSVYLADRVLPMLPERLSNGICSLNASVDRLAFACEMKINEKGDVFSHEIFPAVINVKKRLSYSGVKDILEKGIVPDMSLTDMAAMLTKMSELSKILRAKRMRRGAIDFDFKEQKIILNEVGTPVDIKVKERTIAESIIEEFMLIANETVAKHMFETKIPSVYRVHEEPDDEKIAAFSEFLATFGLKLSVSKRIKPIDLQKMLEKIKGTKEEKLISKIMLRSLKQAEYKAENHGHFGLSAEYYTHFTSPIRRYPDLIVHRLLKEVLSKKITAKRIEKLRETLPEIVEHASKQERRAEICEREVDDLKKAEYMQKYIGEEFIGTISSVTSYGLFVELANGVEGLLHMSSLTDDYYVYIEERYCIIGERTKKLYSIGDEITVEVLKVDISERTIDFILPGQKLATREHLLSRLTKKTTQTKSFKEKVVRDSSGKKKPVARKKNKKTTSRSQKRR